MKPGYVVTAAAAGLLLLGCPEGPAVVVDAGGAAKPTGGKVIARLDALKGTVTVERAGKAGPAVAGNVEVGDAIETGGDGEAKVLFTGGRTIEVGPDTRFAIKEGEGGLVLDVSKGLVLSRVTAGGEQAQAGGGGPRLSLSILTPFGLTRVGSGENEVSVGVGKDAADVKVLLGAVEFVSRNGEAIAASAGDNISAGGDKASLSKGRALVLDTLEITLFPATGKAEVRKHGTKVWKGLGKAGESIAAGDSLRVKEGRSTLQLGDPDSRLTLQRGAELSIMKSGRKAGVDDTQIELAKGELVAQLVQGRKTRVQVGALELLSDVGGQFTITKTSDGYALTSTTGDLKLKQNGKEADVKAGQAAKVALDGTATVRQLAREDVAIPSKMGVKLYHPGIGNLAVGWEGDKKDYLIEVAGDSAFAQPVLAGLVHDAYVNLPAPTRGSLFWRVKDAATGAEVTKGSATLSTEPASADLSRLRNEVADGSEKTTIYYQDKPPAVTFTYKAEAKAAKYRLRVYREASLDKPAFERVVKEERAPLEAGVLVEGSYVWSVTPMNEKGDELRGGRMNKLEMAYDNAVPTVVVRTPRNGDPASGAKVDVAGIAPVGSKLWVNGRQVALDSKARFESSTAPVGRPPTVVFRVVQPNGSETYTVRVLRRGP